MRTRCTIASAACALVLTQAAQAETGFYAGLSVTKSDYELAPAKRPPSSSIIYPVAESYENDDDLGYSVTLGYRIHQYVAAELAYLQFGSVIKDAYYLFPVGNITFLPKSEQAQYSIAGPALSALGILPIGDQWEAYVRVGVLSAEFTNDSLSRKISSSEKWLAGAGVQWGFSAPLAVRLEYQRLETTEGNISIGDADVDQVSMSAVFRF